MEMFKKLKDLKAIKKIISVIHSIKLQKTLLLIFVFAIIFAILLSGVMPEKYDLNVGDIAPVDIKAPRDFVDNVATQRLIDQAVSEVKPKYDLDTSQLVNSQNKCESFFDVLLSSTNKANIKDSQLTEYIDINPQYLAIFKAMKNDELQQLKSIALNLLQDAMSKPVSINSLNDTKLDAKNKILALNISEKLRDPLITLVSDLITPNMMYNNEETKIARAEAAQNVKQIEYKKGQNIVKSGDVITKDQYRILNSMGLIKNNNSFDITLILGLFVLTVIIIVVYIPYIYLYRKDLKDDIVKLTLLCLMFIIMLLLSLIFKNISIYLIPAASLSMLTTVLFDYRISFINSLVFLVLAGILVGFSPALVSICFAGPLVSSYLLSRVKHRNTIMWSGLVVGIVNAFCIISLGLLNSTDIYTVLKNSLWGIINGLICSVLAIGTLPFWEAAFYVVTPMRLIELSNPNQPLLKKLLIEAPGTYHHSILVANLAEAAAAEIGANALLARVGAYYHDIGKLERPYFFKENQLTPDNPHDNISPDLSTLIITSHVKDGVKMAKKHRLPSVITDIIEQHHGNSLVIYFFNKALNQQPDDCNEKNFRYPGPKPLSKESALVMLADSVEAAVRSLTSPNENSIYDTITKIIKLKVDDGQLDDCSITLKDLNITANAFKRILTGIYHNRLEYPEVNI